MTANLSARALQHFSPCRTTLSSQVCTSSSVLSSLLLQDHFYMRGTQAPCPHRGTECLCLGRAAGKNASNTLSSVCDWTEHGLTQYPWYGGPPLQCSVLVLDQQCKAASLLFPLWAAVQSPHVALLGVRDSVRVHCECCGLPGGGLCGQDGVRVAGSGGGVPVRLCHCKVWPR